MDKIIALIAVALGWLFSELSSVVRLRREDRRAAGPVLTDLFEIRNRLVSMDECMKEFGHQLQLPHQARLQLQQYLLTVFPEPPGFIEKYEEAVSTLARVDPIRAFRLRGQMLVGPFVTALRGLAASTPADSELWSTIFEPEFQGRFKRHLEELILEVARAHGWLTWWNARKRLRQPALSQEDKKWISDFIEKFKSAAETTQQTPSG